MGNGNDLGISYKWHGFGLKGQRSALGLTAIRRGFELYECLLVVIIVVVNNARCYWLNTRRLEKYTPWKCWRRRAYYRTMMLSVLWLKRESWRCRQNIHSSVLCTHAFRPQWVAYISPVHRGLGLVGLALYLVDWPIIVLHCLTLLVGLSDP